MKITSNDAEHDLTERDATADELTADRVRQRLSGSRPQRIRHQGVRVDGRVFPVKQAFELATGTSRDDFTAQAAAQQLSKLGFELVGEADPRHSAAPAPAPVPEDVWPSRSAVQGLLLAHLVATGWQVGADDVTRDGESLAVEVTGFAGRNTLATHWYGQAILEAMRARSLRPDARSVIALPDVQQYSDLYAETAGSLALSGIEVWWVAENGRVS